MVGQVTAGVTVQGGNGAQVGAVAAAPVVKRRANRYRKDAEMGAMVKVDHILQQLDPAVAGRVLVWVTGKFQERTRAPVLAAAPVAPHPAESF